MMTTDSPHFTVFGGCYVAERRNKHLSVAAQPAPSAAISWIVCASLLTGISVFAAEIAFFALWRQPMA